MQSVWGGVLTTSIFIKFAGDTMLLCGGWHFEDHGWKAYVTYNESISSYAFGIVFMNSHPENWENSHLNHFLCSVVQGREPASERLHDQPGILSRSPDSDTQSALNMSIWISTSHPSSNRSTAALPHVCKMAFFFFNNLKCSSESQIFFSSCLDPKSCS